MKILLILLLTFSFNAFAGKLEQNTNISASEVNENLSFLFQTYIKQGMNTHIISSPNFQEVSGRSMSFVKKYDDTLLSISYSDVLRATAKSSSFCTVNIEVVGHPCSNGAITKMSFSSTSLDINAVQMNGECKGIPKGNHTLRVIAKAAINSGGQTGACEFSWANDSTFLMLLKENY